MSVVPRTLFWRNLLLIAALIALIINYSVGRKATARLEVLAKFQHATEDPNLKFEQRADELKALSQQETDRQIAAQASIVLGDEFAARLVSLPATATPDERKKAHDQAQASTERRWIASPTSR